MVSDIILSPTLIPVATMAPVVPDVTIRTVAGITCFLSVIGSLVIIITYCVFKSLRTAPRLILVHLSIMDLGTALSNLVGLSVDFNSFYLNSSNISYVLGLPQAVPVSSTIHYGCVFQAATADYFTVGSFMWTISMAIYLCLRIIYNDRPAAAQYSLYTSGVLSYLLPLLIVFWKGFTHRLGFSPFASEGWCGDKLIDLKTGRPQILLDFISYQMWVGLTFILVPILYISVICYIYIELQGLAGVMYQRVWAVIQNLDYKLLLIPLAFLLLRIWAVIDTITYVYMMKSFNKNIHYVLTCLSAIGDSGQGFVNALLFVCLTKKVREKICPCCRLFKTCKKNNNSSESRKLLMGGTSVQKRVSKSDSFLVSPSSSTTY